MMAAVVASNPGAWLVVYGVRLLGHNDVKFVVNTQDRFIPKQHSLTLFDRSHDRDLIDG